MHTPYELQPENIRQPLDFTEAGRRYHVEHIFRVPTLKDWLIYDAALGITLADVRTAEGPALAHRDNRTAAAGELWDRLAERVEGYAPPQEGQHWKGVVPYLHRVVAATPRAQVFAVPAPSATEDAAPALYSPGLTPVHLIAAGGLFVPLVHWFRRADAAQVIEFDRLNSERHHIRATGGVGGKAIIPSLLGEYVRLYDALIDSVEGYTVNGSVPAREQAVHGMDAWHKMVALRALFLPPQPEPPAEAGAEVSERKAA